MRPSWRIAGAFEARTASRSAPAAARSAPRARPRRWSSTTWTRPGATLSKLTEILDGVGIPYKVMNIQDDPAAQMAVRRDSKGHRLPVVFIAGEVIGGRTELTNLATSGELRKKVFG